MAESIFKKAHLNESLKERKMHVNIHNQRKPVPLFTLNSEADKHLLFQLGLN